MERLLCIVGSMNAGGAETFLMKLYRKLDRTKYQMDFAVAVKEKGFYDDEILDMGGKIFQITPKSKGIFKNFNSIRCLVKREGYQSVLRTSQHSLSALELYAARLGGAKNLIFRSSNTNTTSGRGIDLMLHKLCAFMPMIFANVRIAPSTEAADFMFGNGCVSNGKAFLLHNGVDLALYRFDMIDRESVKKEFCIENKLVVGHVGRFNHQKNHEKLIDVFQQIVKREPNSVLMLVGQGELEEYIKRKVNESCIADKVIFTGVRSDVPRLLSGMDVFVFPSLYEGMPNTIIEAQANGLPCVISNSITKEAEVTDLINYLSLEEPNELWAETVLELMLKETDRASYSIRLKEQGYGIEECTSQFIKMVF